MKEIHVNQGQVILVDDEDFERASAIKWSVAMHPHTKTYRAYGRVNGRMTSMSRFIMDAGPGEIIDHANRNTLDNRRANLRRCTATQNRANSQVRRDCLSGYKGVSFNRRNGKWCAQLYIGTFVSQEDAAKAYDAAARSVFGEFALTNFPEHS